MIDHRSQLRRIATVLAITLTAATAPVAAARADSPPGTHPAEQVLSELDRIDHLLHEGQYPAAEEAAKESLAGLEAVGQGQTVAASRYADRLVEVMLLSDKATRQETLHHARLAVAIKESELGADDIETARSLERLGRVLTRTASFAEAEQALTRSLGIAERAGPAHRADQANALRSSGHMLCMQGNYTAGHKRLTEALAIQESAHGEDPEGTAATLRLIGECFGEQRDPAGTMYLRRSLPLTRSAFGDDHPAVAAVLTSLGLLLTLDGKFAEAKDALERALAIYDRTLGPDSAASSATLTWLGRLLTESADYSAARAVLEQAHVLRTNEYGPLDRETATTLYEQCILLMRMGDFEGADQAFEQIVSVREKLLGPNHSSLADALNLWGITLLVLGGHYGSEPDPELVARAESYMTRALDIRTASLGPRSPAVANSLMNMVNMLYEPAGNYEQAFSFGQRALDILESRAEPSEFNIYYSLYSLAVASRGLGNLEQALAYTARAIQVRERVFGPMHPGSAGMLGIHAQLLVETGRDAEAASLLLHMDQLMREHLELVARTATENEALLYAWQIPHGWDLLIVLAAREGEGSLLVSATWDGVMRSRGLVMDEIMTRRKIDLQISGPELARLRDELDEANRQLAQLVVGGPEQRTPEEFGALMDAAHARKERAERAFAAANAEYRRSFELSHSGLSEVIEALPADTALVAFFNYLDYEYEAGGPRKPVDTGIWSYGAFVVKMPEKVPRFIPLGSAEAIEALIARWRDAVTRPALSGGRANMAEGTYRSEAAKLREAVWDPIAAELGKARQVFIVPEGDLHAVSFAALPTGDAQYLVETGPMLHYLSSERDVLRVRPASPRTGLLALGAPNFESVQPFASLRQEPSQVVELGSPSDAAAFRGSHSACDRFQSMRFEPLQASLEEVETIAELWRHGAGASNSATVLTGAAASETAFRREAAGARVLHLATHGFFLGGECGSVLNPLEGADVINENPLLLSGLVLAGANHRAAAGPSEDDGILTAEEIATLDLGGTDWVVLSACDTGGGEIFFGEGVLGLQRAFRIAGAQTLVMSLWPVEDEVARDWMAVLYRRHFVEAKDTVAATRDASLELLAARRARGLSTHPFYWAGFVASGDWR